MTTPLTVLHHNSYKTTSETMSYLLSHFDQCVSIISPAKTLKKSALSCLRGLLMKAAWTVSRNSTIRDSSAYCAGEHAAAPAASSRCSSSTSPASSPDLFPPAFLIRILLISLRLRPINDTPPTARHAHLTSGATHPNLPLHRGQRP